MGTFRCYLYTEWWNDKRLLLGDFCATFYALMAKFRPQNRATVSGRFITCVSVLRSVFPIGPAAATDAGLTRYAWPAEYTRLYVDAVFHRTSPHQDVSASSVIIPIRLPSMGGASGVTGGMQLPSVSHALPREKKKIMRALSTLPVHCRSIKIDEMCQNTAFWMLNFFLFPVVNGHSNCCQFSLVESPTTTIFFCPMPSALPPRCPLTQKSWGRPCFRLFDCVFKYANEYV